MQRNRSILCLAVLLASQVFFISCTSNNATEEPEKLKALIIDGQSNHGIWPKTTAMMKDYLETTGLFTVAIERSKYLWLGPHSGMDSTELMANYLQYALDDKEYIPTAEPQTDSSFSPNFSEYDVVITQFGWKSADWPAETKANFESYVANGGGLVVLHAANNAFGEWPEYNEMIGLGGWGGRNTESGPYVYYSKEDETLTRDPSEGNCGGHGAQKEAVLTIREPEHPIVKGMPMKWLHTMDEVYEKLRGPAENMTILATSFSGNLDGEMDEKRTNRHEPMMMTIDYKSGRVFHLVYGHSALSMECIGIKTSLERGAEWAATGKVTQDIPANFPTEERISKIDWTKPVTKNEI